jgi:hypothetical protein
LKNFTNISLNSKFKPQFLKRKQRKKADKQAKKAGELIIFF